MNKYFFFTYEGDNGSSIDKRSENIPFLGIEKGVNLFEAKQKLISKNKWIKNGDFDENSIKSKQLLSEDNKNDIKTVVSYLWEDEKKHFEENDCPDNHIFITLKKLKELIAE